MSGLNGRVRALEREVSRVAGCRTCGGQPIVPMNDDGNIPDWIDTGGRCRGCGLTVKLCDWDAWEAL